MRNAFRNSTRTAGIVIILALSVGLALSMMVARAAVEAKITSVKQSVGTVVTINPAGARGFEGGGTALTSSDLAGVTKIAHVASVTSQLNDRLTSSNTSLESAITAGSLGQRFSENSGVGFQRGEGMPPSDSSNSSSSSDQNLTRTFTPPVTVTGVSSLENASVYGGTTVSYTSGQAFDPSKDAAVAVVGKALAEKNSLKVGSTFTAYDTTITVVGIYDTGTEFSNAGLLMPLSTLQRLSNQTGAITSATATVDSSDNLAATTTTIKNNLGSKADVTNEQETADNAVIPLKSVAAIALYSFIGAIVAGAVIIFLTMMMIVRERRREIGVMKAIGSSNATTMLQFAVESVTLTVIGLVVGFVFTIFAAGPITNAMVASSSSSNTTTQTDGPGRGFARMAFNRTTRQIDQNIKTVTTSINAGTLGYGILAALVIAIIGSAVPAYFISKVRPSEVMRTE